VCISTALKIMSLCAQHNFSKKPVFATSSQELVPNNATKSKPQLSKLCLIKNANDDIFETNTDIVMDNEDP
jgi:hypothetical protein